jgi:hypothetical protein
MFGWIIEYFFYLPTLLNSKRDYYALDEVLDEIEAILKYAYRQRGSSRITERPVIFIDEIGKLQPMVLHSLTHSLIHSFIHSLTHSLTHSFTHSLIYTLAYLLGE